MSIDNQLDAVKQNQLLARVINHHPPRFRSTGDMARNAPDEYAALFGPPEGEEDWLGDYPLPMPTAEEIDAMAAHYGAA